MQCFFFEHYVNEFLVYPHNDKRPPSTFLIRDCPPEFILIHLRCALHLTNSSFPGCISAESVCCLTGCKDIFYCDRSVLCFVFFCFFCSLSFLFAPLLHLPLFPLNCLTNGVWQKRSSVNIPANTVTTLTGTQIIYLRYFVAAEPLVSCGDAERNLFLIEMREKLWIITICSFEIIIVTLYCDAI